MLTCRLSTELVSRTRLGVAFSGARKFRAPFLSRAGRDQVAGQTWPGPAHRMAADCSPRCLALLRVSWARAWGSLGRGWSTQVRAPLPLAAAAWPGSRLAWKRELQPAPGSAWAAAQASRRVRPGRTVAVLCPFAQQNGGSVPGWSARLRVALVRLLDSRGVCSFRCHDAPWVCTLDCPHPLVRPQRGAGCPCLAGRLSPSLSPPWRALSLSGDRPPVQGAPLSMASRSPPVLVTPLHDCPRGPDRTLGQEVTIRP